MYLLRVWFFFFNDTATTEIYTLSLHDALPIFGGPGGSTTTTGSAVLIRRMPEREVPKRFVATSSYWYVVAGCRPLRSEEHTSELQSRQYLVCRLLLEKKKIEATTL